MNFLQFLITLFISFCLIAFGSALLAADSRHAVGTDRHAAELITAAHQVLDLGFDCHASGASREACHAQLTTAIRQRVRQVQ
jgi:hypothetical protein